MRIVTNHPADGASTARIHTPRDDVVVERAVGDGRFVAETGPFSRYKRTLTEREDGSVDEVIDCALAVPFWWPVFWGPMRAALRRRPRDGHGPWWAPPAALDTRAATVLGLLASLAIVEGYTGTLLTQTITYAADEFGADRSGQGTTLAAVRVGVLLALVLAARADRFGRRRLLVTSAAGACLAAAAGAVAPTLGALAVTQMLVTGFGGATGILIAITSAEEMPAGARAYAYSLLTMAGALGAGMCLWVLPVADLGERGWRVTYAVPLLGLAVVAAVARRLPESRRFERPHAATTLPTHGRRLALLAGAAFLGALFIAPAFQFQNDFLREEHGFSAARISLFTILTSTPGALGIVFGGRLADVRGRRLVGAVGVAGGTLAVVASFASSGWPLWAWAAVGSVVGGLAVPSLGVYRPELFPTALRGRASGVIGVVALTGSAIGLVTVGRLVDRWGSYAGPIALMAIGPLLMAVLVIVAFPETKSRELEDLNPEDLPDPAVATTAT